MSPFAVRLSSFASSLRELTVFSLYGSVCFSTGAMGRPTNLVGSLDPDAPSRPYGVRGGGELGAEDSVRSLASPRPRSLESSTFPELTLTSFSSSSSYTQNHNLSLLPALFSYLRYGRAEDCAALCRANDQSWRGASLVGGGSGWWIGGLGE